MANGAYHGKKSHGINIRNPLSLPVQVVIKCETGALRTGDGKETWRTIRPEETIYVGLKGSAEVDIQAHILRYDETGRSSKVGQAEWEHTEHKSSTSGKKTVSEKEVPGVPPPGQELVTDEERPVEEEVEIRSLGDMMKEMKKEEVAV